MKPSDHEHAVPAFMGYSHLSLSVTDRDASVAFYREALGFEPYEVLDDERWWETISVHPATGTVLGFQQHRDNGGEPFRHQRTGLDHLALRVRSRDELLAWQAHLAAVGATYTPVVDKEYGSVLALRDPDGIQVELFHRRNHPEPAGTDSASTVLPTRLTRQLGLRYPFAGAGMGFVGHERLAAAVSNAGGLGMLGASPDPAAGLEVMIDRMDASTDRPWGVDLIVADTAFGPAATEDHVEVCARRGVGLVVFHHDLPPAAWVRRLVSAGARVWMQVPSLEMAQAAVELGVHGLVAQGREAGGHARGTVPLLDLLGALRPRFPDTVLLAAGGIVDGATAAAALRAGADGVWVGTRLVASEEAHAHPEYKQRLVDSTGETVVSTAFGPEWPGQSYRLLATEHARTHPAAPADAASRRPIGTTRLFPHSLDLEYEMPAFCSVPPPPSTSGDFDAMAYPAGQGVGAITSVLPAATIIEEMMAGAQAELESR